MTPTHEPYVDLRDKRHPYAVTLRSASGNLVRVYRFGNPEDAWAFYREHSA